MSAPPKAEQPAEQEAGGHIAHRVFWPAGIVILAFVLVVIGIAVFGSDQGKAEDGTPIPRTQPLTDFLKGINTWITNGLGWYYILIVAGFIVFALFVGFSRFGKIRLGPDDSKPEFGKVSWFAMLFSAGMGIGLLFYGVAEPLVHYRTPPYVPVGEDGSPIDTTLAAKDAIHATYMHWGVHAWAIYVLIGLALAYAVHRKGRPLSLRWALEPLLGDRVKGALGDLIDIIAIVATLFGVSTSLGLGAAQINAGFDALGISSAIPFLATPGAGEAWSPGQIVIIACVTSIAVWSVVTGVKKGIKWLSNINVVLAALLLIFVIFMGPTLFIFREFFTSIGYYFQRILFTTFDAGAFPAGGTAYGIGEDGQPVNPEGAFQAAWTAFYWGWWISWAPFVGVFIARISRGRTVREFVWGVLLVPTIVSFLWFSALGGTALYRAVSGDKELLYNEAGEALSNEAALFNMLKDLPAGQIMIGLATVLIVTFFVTSSDSGSLVVDMLASGGNIDPPKWSRIFWAVLEGAVAAALLIAGGTIALQTAAVVTALPFSIVMVLVAVATLRAFSRDPLMKRLHAPPAEPEPAKVDA